MERSGRRSHGNQKEETEEHVGRGKVPSFVWEPHEITRINICVGCAGCCVCMCGVYWVMYMYVRDLLGDVYVCWGVLGSVYACVGMLGDMYECSVLAPVYDAWGVLGAVHVCVGMLGTVYVFMAFGGPCVCICGHAGCCVCMCGHAGPCVCMCGDAGCCVCITAN